MGQYVYQSYDEYDEYGESTGTYEIRGFWITGSVIDRSRWDDFGHGYTLEEVSKRIKELNDEQDERLKQLKLDKDK